MSYLIDKNKLAEAVYEHFMSFDAYPGDYQWRSLVTGGTEFGKITHWMRLPKPAQD